MTDFLTLCLIFIQKCEQVFNSLSAEFSTVCCISEHADCALNTTPNQICCIKQISQNLKKKS